MDSMTRRFFGLCAAAIMMATPIVVKAENDSEIRLRTTLRGARINGLKPSGHADFRSRPGRSRLNVEVEDVNVAPGTVLRVLVDGSPVGTIRVDAMTRGGELELNTNDGDMVPSVKPGSIVVVRSSERALLAGVF
jgi:hypothetical protein